MIKKSSNYFELGWSIARFTFVTRELDWFCTGGPLLDTESAAQLGLAKITGIYKGITGIYKNSAGIPACLKKL